MAGMPARGTESLLPADLNLGPHRNLVEAELVASAAWWIRIRWIAGAGVILASWIVGILFPIRAPQLALTVIGAGILAYNLAFYIRERQLKRLHAPADAYMSLVKWQVGMDWLAMTLLIHFSGGIESPVIMFFFLHIIIASTFFPPRTALAFTLMAIGLVTAIALLEYAGIVPHQPIVGLLGVPLYQNGLYILAILFFFSCTALMSEYMISGIHERLRQREEQVVQLTGSLQRATIRLQALNEDARVVGSTLDLPEVLKRLVKSTSEAMGVRACSIRLLDKSGQHLEPVAMFGLSQTYLDKGPVIVAENLLAQEVLSGKIVNVPDAPNSPMLQYPEEAKQEGIRSMLSAPLTGKKGPIGILRAYALEVNRFTPDDEAFLAAIAAQGSIAIENAMAYEAVAELDTIKSRFIRTVTHELRSPVSVVRSLLGNIVAGYAGEVSPQQQDILDRAVRRIDFLQKLIDDLLDLAAGKAEVTQDQPLELLRLEPAIEQVVKRFEVPAEEKDLALVWHNLADGEDIIVMATPDGIDRILNNLVSNAVKYTQPGGFVTITSHRIDGEVHICIEDTGIGIPAEAMGHLFEEFYRAPNAKAIEREGTGLGLTIVKDLVTRFGGRVSAQSATRVGTCFTVALPLEKPGTGGKNA
jgi:signal transduction histidine kinase